MNVGTMHFVFLALGFALGWWSCVLKAKRK